MQTQDHKKINSSGHGVHVCHKCGWPFPNPHPSAKQRRSHKKICGTVEGSKLASSEESNPNLNAAAAADDISNTPSLNVVNKAAKMTTSLSSRSDEDVYSDAKADFGDPPAVAGYVAVRERAVVMQDLSEDVGENSVVGDLYPPNIDDGTQPQNVECSRPENERLEIYMPSQLEFSSSTVDSISNSDSTVKVSVSESTLQCPKIDIVQESVEKGNLETALGKNSEEVENQSSDYVAQTSEAILLPQKSNGDSTEFISEGLAVELVGKQVDEFGDNNDFSKEFNFAGETNSSGKGTVEVETSEDLTNIPSDFTVNTFEAVSVPQMVTEDNLEFLPSNAVMEVSGDQGEVFDAKNDCFFKADTVEQINGTKEATGVEAVSPLVMLDGLDSFVGNTHVSVVPDALPLKEFSKDVLDDYENQKTEKLPDDVTLDLAQEAEHVDHGMDEVNKKAVSSTSLTEPSKSQNNISEDMISEALVQEKYSTEEVVCQDKDENDVGGYEMVTSTEEQKSLGVSSDTDLLSVLDDNSNLTLCINNVKPVHNDSEHDEKEDQMFDGLEADGNKLEEEKLPLTTDRVVDHSVRSGEVEENFSLSTPSVALSDDRMDDKVEVQRDDEHEPEAFVSESTKASVPELQDSGTEVNLSSSNQILGEECVNLLGTTVTSGTDNDANMTEGPHFEENFVHKASDSVDFSLLNNATNHNAKQDEDGVFQDAKELQNFDEKVSAEQSSGKVDLGLISDNDDDIVSTQNSANKKEAGIHVEALSVVEDGLTEKKDENHVKLEPPVQELDSQVDSISQTDSVEGNWGSVSVLSAFSDVPAVTETGSQPSQSSTKLEKANLQPKSDIFNLPKEAKTSPAHQNEGALEAQTSDQSHVKTNESSESKKNEEIIAKVTNWSTASGKQQHMSLKTILGGSSSPNAKDNPPIKKTQETEEPGNNGVKGEMQQEEWDSPARYPTNIKREKAKVKSKPYWAPFICCSSSNYH
ncbi:hypothetical protein V2J09_024042 [Rumex salicifolius]